MPATPRDDARAGAPAGQGGRDDRREALLPGPVAFARGPAGWWAITEGFRIWTSPDGRLWDEVTSIPGLRANCVLPDDGGALVGTSEAHIVRVAAGKSERVRSFD